MRIWNANPAGPIERTVGGIRIIESKWLPSATEPRWRFYPDWRARLARNLARPSTGKWEPLDAGLMPNVFLIGGNFYAHPNIVAALVAYAERD